VSTDAPPLVVFCFFNLMPVGWGLVEEQSGRLGTEGFPRTHSDGIVHLESIGYSRVSFCHGSSCL
jgi:hypothetical protein